FGHHCTHVQRPHRKGRRCWLGSIAALMTYRWYFIIL
ncbi:unnamed protein product, partial [Tetraodon nigroviridis]